jgi:hypothetical protein
MEFGFKSLAASGKTKRDYVLVYRSDAFHTKYRIMNPVHKVLSKLYPHLYNIQNNNNNSMELSTTREATRC